MALTPKCETIGCRRISICVVPKRFAALLRALGKSDVRRLCASCEHEASTA